MEREDACPEIGRITGALEVLGDALASASLERLLAAEAVLAEAVGALPQSIHLDRARVREIETELARARAALLRCRRLGASLADVSRISLDTQGATSGYDRQGCRQSARAAGVLQTRV